MEELLAESKIEQLKEGSVITGTVMEIRPTEVVIDFLVAKLKELFLHTSF